MIIQYYLECTQRFMNSESVGNDKDDMDLTLAITNSAVQQSNNPSSDDDNLDNGSTLMDDQVDDDPSNSIDSEEFQSIDINFKKQK